MDFKNRVTEATLLKRELLLKIASKKQLAQFGYGINRLGWQVELGQMATISETTGVR